MVPSGMRAFSNHTISRFPKPHRRCRSAGAHSQDAQLWSAGSSRLAANSPAKRLERGLRRQVAMPKQPRRLFERRVSREFVEARPAVDQLAAIAVHSLAAVVAATILSSPALTIVISLPAPSWRTAARQPCRPSAGRRRLRRLRPDRRLRRRRGAR